MSKKIHYTELFYSIQGEGRYQGVPSVFFRTFGCNFKCKNFSRYNEHILGDDITHNPEVLKIIENIDEYKSFEELPLVNTGCDSYSSVYPEFKKFVKKESVDAIAQAIVELLPHKEWRDEHLVITGGEPLLGWQRAYPELLNHPLMKSLKELTFETNGTQTLSKEFRQYLLDWTLDSRRHSALTFSVSPKLSCSGEKREDAIKPEIIRDYQSVGYTYLKFVIATEEDAKEALEVTELYRQAGFTGPVYLMPVGGVESVYAMNNKRVAELALKHGVRYSDRMHIPLWGNAWNR